MFPRILEISDTLAHLTAPKYEAIRTSLSSEESTDFSTSFEVTCVLKN